MALGNTLGSHLLAVGRLAPVQVGFHFFQVWPCTMTDPRISRILRRGI